MRPPSTRVRPPVVTLKARGFSPAAAEPGAAVLEQQINEIFDFANEEYKAGNYEAAVRLYEDLLSAPKINNSDIYYNLGNSYLKLNQYGKAIAAYRRALAASPREQDALANLHLARSLTRDEFDSPKSTELLREVLFFHYELNRTESEIIFLGAYCAAAALGILSLFRKTKGLRWAAFAAVTAAALFGVSVFAHLYREARPSAGVVTAQEVDIHTGPGENYLTAFYLHDGAELEIHKKMDEWYQIELSDGRRGWIKDNFLEII